MSRSVHHMAASGTRRMPKRCWLALMTLGLLAGCIPVKEKDGEASSVTSTSKTNIIDFNQLSTRASTMLDKKCENPVAPFTLTDNVATVLFNAGKVAANDVATQLNGGGKVQGQQVKHKIPQTIRLAARQLNWLPMVAEKAYGDYLFEQETDILSPDSKKGKQAYQNAQKILDDVLASVPETSEYQFQIHILKQSGTNARATPGGHLYIDEKLATNPAYKGKAYFAVAHEISHVLQRHETRALQGRVIDAVSLVSDLPTLLKTMNTTKSNPKAIIAILGASKEMFSRYHADQEMQADACAVRLLSNVFTDKRELAANIKQFEDTLPKATAEQGKPQDDLTFLSELVTRPMDRHPNTRERVAHLDEMQIEIYKNPKQAKKAQ